MSQKLTIEIWSDLICPWCWIGKRRLERALTQFPHRDEVDIVHRSFRIMPGMPTRSARDVLPERIGSPEQIAAKLRHVESEAAKEGLEFHLIDMFAGDTFDAQQLVKLAVSQGLQDRAVERFYRAAFTETVSLFDRETLLRLAEEIGLQRDAATEVLKHGLYASDVEKDQNALQTLGGNGVPFTLVSGQVIISGAQPASTFLRALEQAWNSQYSSPGTTLTGANCGPDGCLIDPTL